MNIVGFSAEVRGMRNYLGGGIVRGNVHGLLFLVTHMDMETYTSLLCRVKLW